MKMTKNNLFITLLLLTSAVNTYTMDQPELEEKKIKKPNKLRRLAQNVGDVLLGKKPLRQLLTPDTTSDTSFMDITADVRKEIILLLTSYAAADTLEPTTKTIRSLSLVNHEMNTLINDRDFCLKIIKYLSARFNCSNLTACKALNTPKAKKQLELQNALLTICKKEKLQTEHWNNNVLFVGLLHRGVDLEFTYDYAGDITTLLIISLMLNSEAAEALIIVGKVDVKQASAKGVTPLKVAEATENQRLIKLIKEHMNK